MLSMKETYYMAERSAVEIASLNQMHEPLFSISHEN